MAFEKHGESCACAICTGSRGDTVADGARRVMRAVMREWGVDAPKDLPDHVLGLLAWTAGFFGGAGSALEQVQRYAAMGADARVTMQRRGSGVGIDVVSPSELERILRSRS